MQSLKILYLHIYENAKTKKIRKMLEKIYGKDNVLSSKNKSRTLDVLILIFVYILCIFCISISFYFLYASKMYMLVIPCIFIMIMIFLIGSIVIYEVVYQRSLVEANLLFKKFKPNVIVAFQFGCILAMNLDPPQVPMLLISPVQENLFSTKMRKKINIKDYPYIIFVHSTNDKKRSLNKTLELVKSVDKQKYRVEIVDGGYNLELLSASDYKGWIDEIYAEERVNAKLISENISDTDDGSFKNYI
ncbi:conserved Plasmodium protein, unknown function [Plasmodium gallinaceum]|uniref:Uncharacterized protein n=1 Tax=Plasmodium gallinaceum TaxID=5849 RepID=A0A1J1GLM3_PLAGA|nr:conserved Plasmodium protein, unknown function [Plasmodium gallinaceum]CRG93117.1 conserved Plasmodium protein, unknown function [Plasmodium gallinaceum]